MYCHRFQNFGEASGLLAMGMVTPGMKGLKKTLCFCILMLNMEGWFTSRNRSFSFMEEICLLLRDLRIQFVGSMCNPNKHWHFAFKHFIWRGSCVLEVSLQIERFLRHKYWFLTNTTYWAISANLTKNFRIQLYRSTQRKPLSNLKSLAMLSHIAYHLDTYMRLPWKSWDFP